MASSEYSVVTPERVSLEYGIAGIGSRCAAVVVDTVLQALAISVLAVALLAALAAASSSASPASGPALRSLPTAGMLALVVGLMALGIFIVTSGYFMFFEILWNGQSPGKRLLGLRVIRENGYPLRPMDAVIRNLVRIVDFLPGFYAIGVLTMLVNRRSRRLGDFAAGTIVVREGTRRSFSAVSFGSAEAEPHGYALSSADATLIRDFLLRRASMHPKARAELARRLALAVSERYHLPLDESADAESFLEQLAV